MRHDGADAQRWSVVALLWVVACLNYLDRMMITTMRGSLVEAIPMSDADFGLLTSVFLWVYAGLSPLAGYLADRFSRKWVIVASLFIWSTVTWLTSQASSFEELLAARALMGVSEACYIPAALALIADAHPGATRSLATGVHITGISVGAALGGLGGFFAESHGWQTPFIGFGLFGMAYAVLLALALPSTSHHAKPSDVADPKGPDLSIHSALKSLVSNRMYLLALAAWSLLGIPGWVLGGWMPTYLGETFGLGQGRAGMSATAYMHVSSMVGVLVGGAWADRWSRLNPRGRVLVPAIGLCLAAPGILMVVNASMLWAALAGLVIYGVTRAFTDANMMPILCLVADERYRATGYGILNMSNGMMAGVAVYAGGALRDCGASLGYALLLSAITLVVSAGLLFSVQPPARSEAN